jgi:hypothetical protein
LIIRPVKIKFSKIFSASYYDSVWIFISFSFKTEAACCSSKDFSHLATAMVAIPFPIRFVTALASLMNLSTPESINEKIKKLSYFSVLSLFFIFAGKREQSG